MLLVLELVYFYIIARVILHSYASNSGRWIIDPPLEIVVPAKRTPWPDVPPELASLSTARKGVIGDNAEKHKTPRKKRTTRSKRKHGQQADVHGSGTSGGHVEKR